jgi:probable ATP-dependent RNA helicase DDX4
MGDWSDDEKTSTPAPKRAPAPKTEQTDDWGNNDRQENNDDRGSNFSRGRGRGGSRGGRGRGGGNFGDRENNSEGFGERRGGYNRGNRDSNDNEEEGSDNRGSGSRRGRGGFNREDSDRPPRRERNENNENGDNPEEQRREVYIPAETTEEELFASAISAGINFDNFDKIEVHVTGKGSDDFEQIKTFEEANLRDFLLINVTKSGYKKPTPIQKRAIPIIMGKRDLMGCAQTGSGKTAAFVLPILNTIMNDKDTLNPGKPQCLIVAPTRELVIQIRDEAMKFSSGSYVKVALAYGGAASRYQSENIVQGCHVLVATPGRLMDFVNKGVISFEDLKFLVMDEADRMLDMGFRDTIDKVCNHNTLNKDSLTTLMFSATFPDEIQRLAAQYLRNYLFLTVGIVGGASADVEQEFIEVPRREKRQLLTDTLTQYSKSTDEDRILVFVETKRTADYLASFLSETTLSTTSIHGDRLQREREEALRDFRTGKRKVLIATAVAARGLDIKGVTHVINYDLPKEVDEYIHRIGRTGRVGNRGKATSFFDPDVDQTIVSDLVRILTQTKQAIPDFFGGISAGSCGMADKYGGSDIRQPIAAGAPQKDEDEW